MRVRTVFKNWLTAASIVAGCLAFGGSAQAVVITENLFFNYINGPEELAGQRVHVGQMSYDDAAFDFFDPFGGGDFDNVISSAPGATYDPETGNPLESLTLSVRLFGADVDDPSNPEFTHLQDINFPDFPTLEFEAFFEFDPQTEEETFFFVPVFLDYIVEFGSPNGADDLLAAAGVFGFATTSPLVEVSSFDTDVEFFTATQPVPVPAPFALLLAVVGGFGALAFRRRKTGMA